MFLYLYSINKQTKHIMPIEFLYTDSELLKLRSKLLKKMIQTKEDIKLIGEINEYCNRLN